MAALNPALHMAQGEREREEREEAGVGWLWAANTASTGN
jgi:hypothetical protein